MLERVNKIYFKQSDFDSLADMYEAVYTQQLALVRNRYMCLSYMSPIDRGIYVLEFASVEPAFNEGKLLPCWITPMEAREIARMRLEEHKDETELIIKDSLKLDDESSEDIDDDNDDNGGKPDA